jgi:predicted Zn-dependent protease
MSIFGGGYNRGGGGGRGFIVRSIIAPVNAIGGVNSYISSRQVNPTTGEVQHVGMNEDQEMRLGLQAAPQMAREMGGAVAASDPDAQLVDRVGKRLVSSTEAGQSPYRENFHFFLLNDTGTVNAFALPGGQVFITRALFDRLENEAQLAGVLGHEIGHVIHRHSAQQMAKQGLGQALATAAGVGSDDARVAAAAQIANQMRQLSYSRDHESQSDSTGLDYMVKAGYDPREMLGVMQILKTASGGSRQPQFLSSHPDPGNRLQTLQQIIDTKYRGQNLDQLTKGVSLKGGSGRKPTDQRDKW